ncbi:MAG: TIGR03088 family PEP-CTERM/XrtA system glycosyltransferase [Gammaproteobacteria bacterium]|nr:MAG: TIGR03088 family PEP-CTERM/XrtA system glycosyltransferase [Gammaproteobacteria bacterium]
MTGKRPLIAHVIFSLDFGGLENGVVNLLNNLPQGKYRHVVIALTEVTDFKDRINNPDIECIAMHKQPGKDLKIYIKLFRLFKKLRPQIVHTRNLPALDVAVPAWLAGVPRIIHSEHGRDTIDIDGSNKKYQLMRRILSSLIDRFAALSIDLESWLVRDVGIKASKVVRICNGVDTQRFSTVTDTQISGYPQSFTDKVVIGTVGRMEEVKDTLLLIRAFVRLLDKYPEQRDKISLVLVGTGSLYCAAETMLKENEIESMVWMPGARNDIPEILNKLDIFVLPSLAEGISNTILESMSSGLPVIATDVGGNSELVADGETGYLVPPADSEAMADAIYKYLQDDELRHQHGRSAIKRVEANFSFAAMVEKYDALYSDVLRG